MSFDSLKLSRHLLLRGDKEIEREPRAPDHVILFALGMDCVHNLVETLCMLKLPGKFVPERVNEQCSDDDADIVIPPSLSLTLLDIIKSLFTSVRSDSAVQQLLNNV